MSSFRSFRFPLAFLCLFAGLALASAQDAAPRKPWGEVLPPAFVSLESKPGDPGKIVAVFDLVTSADGADKATVEMTDAQGLVVASRIAGKSKADRKTMEFSPSSSGRYGFRVIAARTGVPETKETAIRAFDFILPLAAPRAEARNLGGDMLRVEWQAVPEAVSYEVAYGDTAGQATKRIETNGTSSDIPALARGSVVRMTVTAVRGNDRAESAPFSRTVRAEADRIWNFARFGQSSSSVVNTLVMLDSDAMRFKLNSCTVLPDGQIDGKGGKFTTFHDGISFYYTEIDPLRENFELAATFTIDYINPTPDGQEGFGLLVMDRIGTDGVSMVNHYANSAGIIATKFEETIGGVKRTSKDTLGARFVSGLSQEVLAMGDTGIAKFGKNESHAFSYEQSALIQKGKSYRITLKKTNTGYHAVYAAPNAPPGAPSEFVMYGPSKLGGPGRDKLYLGFAVARGCNASVSDVSLKLSDPASDPAGLEEPPVLLPLAMRFDSPQTWIERDYPLVFNANADGKISVGDNAGNRLVSDVPVKAGEDFSRVFALEKGSTVFRLSFTPDPDFKPAPGTVMAAWNPSAQEYRKIQGPQVMEFRVYRGGYDRKELYVAPFAPGLGDGSAEKPLDLATALAFAKAGQPILLLPGTYRPETAVIIERGNDGAPGNPKTLKSVPGTRAVMDFGRAEGGMQVWGDFWVVEGIEIRNTAGNVKGLQVGGNGCVIKDVIAHSCGDTGIQISGIGSEPPQKWPRDNLVINCVSHDNKDPASNNADGFAAKLTCGPGNVFRGCIAYSNIDDGWDLFSKIESGPIGAVLIEGCVAYRNGSLSDGSGNGDGNGFKLGGDGIAVAHVIRDSFAFANGTSGITSNSDPAIEIENCTSFGNKGSNVNLYGKGDGKRMFKVKGIVSLKGGAADVYREMPELASPSNWFWNGAQCVNSEGVVLTSASFLGADPSTVPGRNADGSVDMKKFLIPGPGFPLGAGAGMPKTYATR